MTVSLATDLARIARQDMADRPAVGARLMMLAAQVARLERAMDEIVADAMTDARAPREGNVINLEAWR
jgi:anti-sigma factor RsiW